MFIKWLWCIYLYWYSKFKCLLSSQMDINHKPQLVFKHSAETWSQPHLDLSSPIWISRWAWPCNRVYLFIYLFFIRKETGTILKNHACMFIAKYFLESWFCFMNRKKVLRIQFRRDSFLLKKTLNSAVHII